jgi:hypothetical protein
LASRTRACAAPPANVATLTDAQLLVVSPFFGNIWPSPRDQIVERVSNGIKQTMEIAMNKNSKECHVISIGREKSRFLGLVAIGMFISISGLAGAYAGDGMLRLQASVPNADPSTLAAPDVNRMEAVDRVNEAILRAERLALMRSSAPPLAQTTDDGPGCRIVPASPSIGADIPLTYFGPPPSTFQKELIGPLQLLRSGPLDRQAGTITLPLYQGQMRDGRNVWYILTDTTDQGNAEALGLNFAPKLNFAATGRGVRTATLMRAGLLVFDSGEVDFRPGRRVAPSTGPSAFPPLVALPGSVGDNQYTPLVRIINAGGHIYNAPVVAFGVTAQQIHYPNGNPDYSLVHDAVVRIDTVANTVTLRLAPGFSFARPVLYLSMDASAPDVAALEEATFAPGLQDIDVGNDDSAFSAVERIFVTINGPTGCENPQRQGLNSALLDGRRPLNVLGGIPTVATDYSPLWDINLGQWTSQALERNYRSRVSEEFQILALVEGGFITGPGGARYGSIGVIVNCPIVFRFL